MNKTMTKSCKVSDTSWHQQSILWLALLLCILTGTSELKAQKVANGSFENGIIPITRDGILNLNANSWSSPTLASPDYFHRRAVGGPGINNMVKIPVNWQGFQQTFNPADSAYAGIWFSTNNYREYLMNTLNKPLLSGHTYKLKYYINLSNNSTDVIDRLGAFFCTSPPAVPPFGTWLLNVVPQIVSPKNVFITDTVNWTLMQGQITPTATMNFMILGSFDANINHRSGNNNGSIYYYYDSATLDECWPKDASFTHTTARCGEEIQFTRNNSKGVSMWDFGDGTTSLLKNPTHTYTGGGVFIVRHTLTDTCDWVATDTIKMLNCCMCKGCGNNLVQNGNFSGPYRSKYGSDLVAKSGVNMFTHPDEFTESTNATTCNGELWCGLDHTHEPGSKFMIADGHFDFAPSPSPPELRAWYQKVGKIKAGQHYCFIAYVKNVCRDCPDKPSLKLQINANGTKFIVDAIEDLAYNDCCESGWTKMCGSWSATEDIDSIELDILISKGQWLGNDAGIDDISFSESDVKPSARFKVTPFDNLNDTVNFCMDNILKFSPDNTNGQHQWDFGDGHTSNLSSPTHMYNHLGPVVIRHIISTPCGNDTFTKSIILQNCCCDVCGPNLVPNGNFSNVNCFFNYFTDLKHNPCVPTTSQSDSATEHSNAKSVISAWYGLDHTNVAGSRLLILDYPINATKRGWFRTVPVVSGQKYCFSMYVKNLVVDCISDQSPSFELRIGGIAGTLIKHVDKIPFDSGWTKVCGTWTAPSNVPVELDLVVLPGAGIGFDLGVDDITFGTICTPLPPGGNFGDQHTSDTTPASGSTQNPKELSSTPANPALSISPIPVKRGTPLQLSFLSVKDDKAIIAVYDENGKIAKQLNETFIKGDNRVSIPTNEFSPGMYYVRVTSGAEMMTRKIIVTD